MNKILQSGVRITASSLDVTGVKKGYEVRKVLVHFTSPEPHPDFIKDYPVWLTDDYVSDAQHLSPYEKAAEEDFIWTALKEASERVEASDGEIPSENGLDCSNERGIILIQNPYEYAYPLGK